MTRDYVTACERLQVEHVDQCGHRVQLSRAITWLGSRWRGRADCDHRYTDSSGRRVVLDRQGRPIR